MGTRFLSATGVAGGRGAARPLGVVHIDTVDSAWAAVAAVRSAIKCRCVECLSNRAQLSDTDPEENNDMTYLCRWPNGDVTAVTAQDPSEAILLLEEVGEARAEWLEECPYFLTHFTLRPSLPADGPYLMGLEEVLAVGRFGDVARSSLWCLYRELDAADNKIEDEKISGDEAKEVIRAAIERERELYSKPKMKQRPGSDSVIATKAWRSKISELKVANHRRRVRLPVPPRNR
jgi:hypothetical protein